MTMRIFVLGATGRTGAQIVDLALARGHRVTAYVRSPHKMKRQDDALTVLEGDLFHVDRLAAALQRHDAVLSALGPPIREAFRPNGLMTDFAASTVAAMTRAGVDRLGIVSAAVLFPGKGVAYRFFRWLLQHHARDLAEMEAVVRATPLDWTIARPPRLMASLDDGYRSELDVVVNGASAVSFRAVAAFLLDSIEQHTYSRSIVGLDRVRNGRRSQ